MLDRQLELLFRTQVAVGGDPTDLELLVRYFDAARIVDELRRDRYQAGGARRAAILECNRPGGGGPRRSLPAAGRYGDATANRRAGTGVSRLRQARSALHRWDRPFAYQCAPAGKFPDRTGASILLVAPRESIRLDTSMLMRGGLDIETIQRIEGQFESEDRGYVALVENIGGIALFRR